MNVIKYLNDLKFVENEAHISSIIASFYEYGIKVSYDMETKPSRFIFSAMKKFRTGGIIDTYISECNGLILSPPLGKKNKSWSIISYPPCTYRSVVSVDVMNKYLAQGMYSVYEIMEGTIITYYYFNSAWRMSTTNGIDVSDVKWDGKSYKDAFTECLVHIGITREILEASLDKSTCYTFGFKHPHRHPFYEGGQPIYNVWFVQGRNIKTLKLEGFKLIPEQKKVLDCPTNIRDLFKKLASSIDDFDKDKTVLYGYILRSNKLGVTYKSVMLESRLLTTIRKLYYQSCFNKLSRQMEIERVRFICLYSYLQIQIRPVFIKYFPQFTEKFAEFDRITSDLVDAVVKIISTSETEAKSIQPTVEDQGQGRSDKFDSSLRSEEEPKKVYARQILSSMGKIMSLKEDKITRKKIREYICDPIYLAIYDALSTE